jgi:hypothetical protein
MPVINSIFNWLNFKRLYEIDLFKQHPHEVQRDVLLNLLNEAANTDWGQIYDFKSIRNEKEFRDRIPVQTYDDAKPYIERMMKGEKNVLWPGETKWFAKSSGTTNDKSKFIPVSKDSFEGVHWRGAKDVLAIYLKNYPDSKFLSGKTLTLGGSHRSTMPVIKRYYGALSAIILENIPFWTEFLPHAVNRNNPAGQN